MHRQEHRRNQREHHDVEHVEPQQRVLADLDPTQQQQLGRGVEQRRVAGHVGADRDRPVRDLVPRQQVAGEAEQDGQVQEHDAHDPVELARRLVGPVVEDPHHVQEHEEHHQVGGPPVDVAGQQAERHPALDVQDVRVRLRLRRDVEEHQVHAGHGEHEEQEEAQAAQAERVGELDRVLPNAHRVQVQEHVVHHRIRPRPLVVGVRVAEQRSPDRAAADALIDPLQETHLAPPATPAVPASWASRYDSL